ncbi:MAG TPA: hypothetical protein DCQ50_12310 [Chryseobacterium sp.]|nr:hypothetical protein [Chryseobacterium sp.]
MSEEINHNDENISDSPINISETQDPILFLESYNPSAEDISNPEDVEKLNENSRKEKMALFGGDLTDIEAFLKHEETRLKFLEFKLKKKTQIAERIEKTKED